jgi:hypothetical protein
MSKGDGKRVRRFHTREFKAETVALVRAAAATSARWPGMSGWPRARCATGCGRVRSTPAEVLPAH